MTEYAANFYHGLDPNKKTQTVECVGTLALSAAIPASAKAWFQNGAKTIQFQDKSANAFMAARDVGQTWTQVGRKATAEAEGELLVSDSAGVFVLKGPHDSWRVTVGGQRQMFLNALPHDETCLGSLAPLGLICPDVDIVTPDGDPTKAGAGGANAENEAVFDDQAPPGEAAGQCLIDCEGRAFPNLKEATRKLVWGLLKWEMPKAGNVDPKYNAVQGRENEMEILYEAMPDGYVERKDNVDVYSFGLKTLTLAFKDRAAWMWRQPVELFFHYAGTGNPSTQQPKPPNWLYYWSQIRGPVAGAGNGVGVALAAGNENVWNWLPATTGSRITLRAPEALSAYIAILGHEQKHENDFFDVIWEGRGYQRAEDRDRDTLRDAWERTQPMEQGSGYGPWTFDVPASGQQPAVPGTNPGQDGSVWAESTANVRSWSDARADVAGKDAVNSILGIDAQDWSDLKVPPGKMWELFDEQRVGEKQVSDPTTSGNNKDF